MKRLNYIIVICLFLAAPVSADIKITLADSGVGTTDGGEFTATLTADSDPIVPFYVAGNSFGTFCIEMDEYINFGTTYKATLNTQAVMGGNNTNSGDPLNPKSAWIYTQWWNGTIAHTDTNANKVQFALWTIEKEHDYSYISGVQTLINAAAAAGWTDIHNVRVLNLTSLGGCINHQDVLVMVPLPATILLGLFGLGVGGWKLRKQRLNKV